MSAVVALVTNEERVVAEDAALAEFYRFVKAMDIDVDPKGMDDDDRKSFETARRRILRAIELGRLVIDEQGQPLYTPTDGTERITFYEPTGASLMAMDQKKRDHNVSKMFATMSDLTRRPITAFSSMKNRDLKVCLAITNLFLD